MPRAQDSVARAPFTPPLALRLLSFLMGAGAAMTAACTPRGAPVEAPIDVTVAPLPPDAGAILTNTSARPSGNCTAVLRAGRIDKSSPGCVVDEQISSSAGVLTYPCSGDGPVDADFGKQHYAGVIVGGEVELTLDTELDWEDGCRWGTRAVIKGLLLSSRGELTKKPIPWTYRDTVISGSDCSGACTARSSFQVLSSKSTAPVTPTTDDDDEVSY